jgi:hypothetical protein
MSEKQKFLNYLKTRNFHLSPVLQRLELVPSYKIDPHGTHYLISWIGCCLFDGSNTKQGDLGCVTFYYGGKARPKYQRQVNNNCEMLKKAFCPKNAKEAIEAYEDWYLSTKNMQESWKTLL